MDKLVIFHAFFKHAGMQLGNEENFTNHSVES